MPHLDKHWIAGVLVGLELLAVPVKQDGLGPQDQHNVVGIRSCAQRIRGVGTGRVVGNRFICEFKLSAWFRIKTSFQLDADSVP
jgi:hypothetical protein